ncbi:phage/plasmid primase, P4 family [Natronomonas gomsonensis]|uniref:DNA primase family protein n=1 Tax=Natronomonas gomsonensis TaxID=1046043 RepID=UPI0015B957B1|nr:phage/plasmid primase, P4 family [Natronomonas gomsonensis]
MVSDDSPRDDESHDSPETTDADAQNTTNSNDEALDLDGDIGGSVPEDATGDEDETTMQDVADSFDQLNEEDDDEETSLATSNEFEERVEEAVEDEDGSVPFKQLKFQLAHELGEDPDDVDEALNIVASVNDGDVVGVMSASARAMGNGEKTWESVRFAYKRQPYDIGAEDIRTDGDATEWAREKCVDFMNEKYAWMYLVDKTQGIKEFYWYDPSVGYYREDAKDRIGALMDEKLGRHSNTHEVNEVARKLRDANKVTSVDGVNAGDAPLRCVKNGVLNIETWELHEHDPEYRFTRRLNARWVPDIDTSRVEEYLEDITKCEQDAKVIAEMMGDVLTKHYRRQWFAMFYGEGANSKSLLMNCLRYTIGDENASSESLHDVASTRWSSAMMAGGTGALANIDPEIPDSTIYDASEIKNNTGNDATSHERKGKDKFSAVNTAKMLFGMNGASKFDEEKRAVVRRIKPIHLPYTYLPEGEVDDDDDYQKVRQQDLEEELTSDVNRAAWLQVMADGLRRLRENDGFSYEQSQQELFDEYQATADTFWSFQTECLRNVRTTHNDTDRPIYLTFNEIYSAYSSYCHERDEQPMDEGDLAKELNKIGSLDIEKYHPADADGANSRKFLAFTDTGFEHAITSTQKRFATRVDDVDVPSMDSEDDSDDDDSGEGLRAALTTAITQLGNSHGRGARLGEILNRNEVDVDSVEELKAELLDGVVDGTFEMTDGGKYLVASDGSDDSDDSDDDSGGGDDGDDGDSGSPAGSGEDNDDDDGVDTDDVSGASSRASQSDGENDRSSVESWVLQTVRAAGEDGINTSVLIGNATSETSYSSEEVKAAIKTLRKDAVIYLPQKDVLEVTEEVKKDE